MKSLTSSERRQLLRFICSFAWADLEVQLEERDFIRGVVHDLQLPPEELAEVELMLAIPPHPDSIDPQDIPMEHKRLFLEKAMGMIRADGVVNQRENTNFRLFKELLG